MFFIVAKSQVPFTASFTDKALEQQIKDLKHHGGIVELSHDDSRLNCLVTTGPQLTGMVKQYLSGFPRFCQTSESVNTTRCLVKTLSDLQNAFVKCTEFMLSGYNKGRVILCYRSERFFHNSLSVTSDYSKNFTRELNNHGKRFTGNQFLEIGTCVRATAMLLVFHRGVEKEGQRGS